MVWTAGAAVIIFGADGWRGELCSCSMSMPCVGEKPSAAAASCTWQTGQSRGCCCASLLGPPKVEGECAGGAKTKHWRTYQYWQVHCLLVLMYSAFRIHQPWLCCALLVCSSLPAQGVSKARAAQLELSCATNSPLDIWFAPFLCAPWWTPVFMESEQQEGNAFGPGLVGTQPVAPGTLLWDVWGYPGQVAALYGAASSEIAWWSCF